MLRAHGLALVAAILVGCGPKAVVDKTEVPRTERDRFGLITCSGKTKDRDCFTNRAIMGASMGAGGAGNLGFLRPELFDQVAMLGIPVVDWAFMLRNLR